VKLLHHVGVGIVVAIVAFGLVILGARFHDGPLGPIAGGPLDSGEWVESEGLDWSFAADLETLELQLLNPPRSRTVWLLLHDGALYIPCGFVDVTLWKQWPHEAFIDGRAVVRIEGRRHPVELVRSDDEAIRTAVLAKVAEKYGVAIGEGEAESAENAWVFRVDPRQRGPQG
jgi:hypothetical protein